MKETYYFSHDYNSRNDPKLQEVLMEFGMEGIGLFWCVVEMMYEEGGKLKLSKCDSYAFALRTDTNVLRKLINVCFECDETHFWSVSVNDRLQKRAEKSQKARESVLTRWNNKDTNVLRTQYDSNTIKEKKEKEKKSESEYVFDNFGNRYQNRKGSGMSKVSDLLGGSYENIK